jgi:alpha-amylase
MNVIADIVINHNSGGKKEYNPYSGRYTYTDFEPKSGNFYRTCNDFRPKGIHSYFEGSFGGYVNRKPDVL